MMEDNNAKLVDLAFDYISAETEPQANQVYDQAVEVVTEITLFTAWLELIDYMEKWNRNGEHKLPISQTDAHQFFSIRRAAINNIHSKMNP